MAKKLFLIVLLFLLSACGQTPKQLATSPFPELRGHWIIVNYWAEWCGPCRVEIPEFNKFSAAHPDIKLFAVYYDHLPTAQVSTLAQKMGIQYPVIEQPIQLVTDISILPTTLLITPEGKVLPPLLGRQSHATLDAALHLTH